MDVFILLDGCCVGVGGLELFATVAKLLHLRWVAKGLEMRLGNLSVQVDNNGLIHLSRVMVTICCANGALALIPDDLLIR